MTEQELVARTPFGEVQNYFVRVPQPVSKASHDGSKLGKGHSNAARKTVSGATGPMGAASVSRSGGLGGPGNNRPEVGTAVSATRPQQRESGPIKEHLSSSSMAGFTLAYSNPSFQAPHYELDQLQGDQGDLTPSPAVETPGVTRWLRSLSPPSALAQERSRQDVAGAQSPVPSSVGGVSALPTPMAHNILRRMQHAAGTARQDGPSGTGRGGNVTEAMRLQSCCRMVCASCCCDLVKKQVWLTQ